MKLNRILCLSLLCFLASFNSVAFSDTTKLNRAIERYQNGYFEDAKAILLTIVEEADDSELKKKTLVYLSLIEIAFRNSEAADEFLSQLLKIDPNFPIEDSPDVNPDLIRKFRKIHATLDLYPPSGEMVGIKSLYVEGDRIDFSIKGRDDTALSEISFKIANKPIRESWHVTGTSSTLRSSLSTEGWDPDDYTYWLLIEDEAGNTKKYSGKFQVVPKPDTIQPTGQIIGIEEQYTEGEKVEFSLQGKDDRLLKEMRFEIDQRDVTQEWEIFGQSATHQISFPTSGWKPGRYEYSFSLVDHADNKQVYSGVLEIKEKQYGYLNIFTKPWTTVYIDGKSMGNTPIAKLKLPAGKMDIRLINESRNIDVIETISISPDQIIRKRFEWE